jgi:curli biogenesis system outer membrane secretion channel CsgG
MVIRPARIGKKYILSLFLVCILLSTSGCIFSFTRVEKPALEKVTRVNLGIMKEVEGLKGKIRKDIRVTVGFFFDETGQFKDADTYRLSTALTKGGRHILCHILYKALGPRAVVEREGANMGLITKEYNLSHTFKKGKPVGLIQYGGPRGGLVGANYMVTGAIVYYHVDRYTGGGGVNIQGYGINFEKAIARVGIELRLVDMSTSEVIWSTLEESWVSGTKVDANVFRFITVSGDDFLITAELGLAGQLPADYAFEICTANAVINMIKENKKIFMSKPVPKGKSKS